MSSAAVGGGKAILIYITSLSSSPGSILLALPITSEKEGRKKEGMNVIQVIQFLSISASPSSSVSRRGALARARDATQLLIQ